MKSAQTALPGFIKSALESRGLVDAYARRSAAQRDHYVRRILRAVRAETVQKRLDQMLDELEGDMYMKKSLASRADKTNMPRTSIDGTDADRFFRRLLSSFMKRYPGETKAWKPGPARCQIAPTSIPGVLCKWSFVGDRFITEICLNRDANTNQRIFDELLSVRAKIEGAIGHGLRWYQKDGVALRRIQLFYQQPATEHDPEEVLERLIEWGIEEMKRLRDVLLPHIKSVP